MPRIAELKEIDGALWAKLEIPSDPSGIGIYTPSEIEELERSARRDYELALRGLFEAIGVAKEGGRRIVGIPNLEKFWRAYDEAQIWL